MGVHMYAIKLSANSNVKQWLSAEQIDLVALERTLNIFFNCIKKSTKNWKKDIKLRMNTQNDDSEYVFNENNDIWITTNLKQDGRSKAKKMKFFLKSFLHEFRHWMQDNVMGVNEDRLCYTRENPTWSQYWNNEWEVDARKFERKHIKDFYTLYKTISKLRLNT